jgi:hypothetical protein
MSNRLPSLYRQVLSYERQNREIARVIAADSRCRGSALAEWAELILERVAQEEADPAVERPVRASDLRAQGG